MFLPTVSDHAAVQYLARVLNEDTLAAKARLEAQSTDNRPISDGLILQYLLGTGEANKLKAEIAYMCQYDFAPPGGRPVFITMDTCNFLVKGGTVVTCLMSWQTCSEKYVTVLEKTSRGRNLGRMPIQPDPISQRELQLARAEVERQMPWRAPAMTNGSGHL
jgi:hypothetical protein